MQPLLPMHVCLFIKDLSICTVTDVCLYLAGDGVFQCSRGQEGEYPLLVSVHVQTIERT